MAAIINDFKIKNGLNVTTTATIEGTSESTSTTTGALIVSGGIGIAKSAFIGERLTIESQASNTLTNTDNALYVKGGAYFDKSLVVDGPVLFNNIVAFAVTSTIYTDNILNLHVPSSDINQPWTVDDGKDIGLIFQYYKGADSKAFLGWNNSTGFLEWYNNGSESINGVFTGTDFGTFRVGQIILTSSTNATNTTSGALIVNGGVGIGQSLYVENTSYVNGAEILTTGTFASLYPNLVYTITGGTDISVSTSTGNVTIDNTSTLQTVTARGATTDRAISITASTASNSTNSGALIVTGGVGIGQDLHVGGTLYATINGSITTATNLSGGLAGSIPYQTAPGSTTFVSIGANGYVLTSNGSQPQWGPVSGLASGSATTATNIAGGLANYIPYQSGPGSTIFSDNLQFNGSQFTTIKAAITGTDVSSNTMTGALVVTGGVGIGQDLYVGGTINGILNGTATTATSAAKWTTARTVTFTGDTTGTFTIDGSADVSNVNLTIQPNSVALGTDTTGDYIATGATNGFGLSGSTSGENSTFTVASNATSTNSASTIVFRDANGDFRSRNLVLEGSTDSTSTTSGALIVTGGAGVGGNLYVGGEIVAQKLTIQLTTVTTTLIETDDIIRTTNNTQSSSTVTGALQVSGGAGIGGNLYVGGTIFGNVSGNAASATTATMADKWTTARTVTFTGDTTGTFTIDGSSDVSNVNLTIQPNSVALGTDTTGDYIATGATSGFGLSGSTSGENSTFTVTSNATSTNSASTIVFRDTNGDFRSRNIILEGSTNSTSTTTGAFVVTGGAGIGQNLYVGGTIFGNVSGNAASATTATMADKWTTPRTVTFTGDTTGTFTIDGSADVSNINLTIQPNSVALGTDTTGDYVSTGATSGFGLSGSTSGENSTFTVTSNATSTNSASTIVFRDANGDFRSRNIVLDGSTNSTSTNTGALQITGGAGIGKDLYVGGQIYTNGFAVSTGTQIATPTSLGTVFGYTTNNGNTAIGCCAGNTTQSGTNNIAIGCNALSLNTSGCSNVAIGFNALYCNTSGCDNIAIGYTALKNNTLGYGNIAVGCQSLTNNTTGYGNIAVGNEVLFCNTAGTSNIALGFCALRSNTTSYNNIAIGYNVLRKNTKEANIGIGYGVLCGNTTGSFNIGIGNQALWCNNFGYENIALGGSTLLSNTIGCYNIGIGSNVLSSNNTGNNNVAIGNSALSFNTIGCNNIAIGWCAGCDIFTGNDNVIIGKYNGSGALNCSVFVYAGTCQRLKIDNNGICVNGSLLYNTPFATPTSLGTVFGYTTGNGNIALGCCSGNMTQTGSGNIAFGCCALRINETGADNVAVGFRTLSNNTTGYWNIGIGYDSLFSNTAGFSNNAQGYKALCKNTTGAYNTAIGGYALACNIFGGCNIAIGYAALNLNTCGCNNIAQGYFSLNSNTEGNNNVAQGYYSMRCNKTGSNNVAIGCYSLYFNSTGYGNVAIGPESLYCNTRGYGNVAIGCRAMFKNSGYGFGNVAIGCKSLYGSVDGGFNVALGHFAMLCNNAGEYNFAVGCRSLQCGGDFNIGIGSQTFKLTTGFNNIGLGIYAGIETTTGNNNIAIGGCSLYGNKTGNDNIAIGYGALAKNQAGNNNIGVGCFALYCNSTGSSNIGMGVCSGYKITTGVSNVVIGGNDGTNIATSSCNVIISDGAGNIKLTANSANQVCIPATTQATSTTTGALVVAGGVGIGKDLWVSGTVFGTTKSFQIPHPTKAGKLLIYASLEGPENGVYLRGRLQDSYTIELPEYWTELVDEHSITVNLTPVGKHQTLFVQKIANNKIIISGSDNIDCFFTVFAERKDVSKLVVEVDGS